MRFDELFLRRVLSDVASVQGEFPQDVTFSIDARTLRRGDVFVALEGAHTDGHKFVADALHKGASGLFIASSKKNVLNSLDTALLKNKVVIIVDDVFNALITLAAAWRAQFDYPVVAVAGSVGKTSTKQIIANVLRGNGNNALISEANQNTRLGLALNMLKMRKEHDCAIFEVGVNKRGEMVKLADMLRPTTALITCVGHCHMEGLGSLSDIALEKRTIFKYFNEDSIGIINGDQSILSGVGYAHPVIKFGSKTTNQIQARKINIGSDYVEFMLKIYKEKYAVRLKNAHSGAVFNALGATVVCHYLGVSDDVIVKGIQEPISIHSRFERCELKNGKGLMINDCYNANPESMKAALLALEHIETGAHKIAILGDMLELGVNSPFWHRQLGRFLRKVPSLKEVILVGNMVEWTKKTLPVSVKVDLVPTWQDAIKKLEGKLAKDNLVLVKGSFGMQLDNVVHHFAKQSKIRETTG